jgi:hypothetical protein
MKQVILKIDGTIEIAALARALASMGCLLTSDPDGQLRVVKRRIRPGRPTLAVVEGKEPEKK